MIGNCLHPALGIPRDDRVVAPQALIVVLIRCGLELVDGHVGRVEPRALRAGADTRNERRVACQPIPGTVVDLHLAAQRWIGDRTEQAVPRAEHLEPVDVVHALGRVDQDRDHRPLVLGQATQIRGQPDGGVARERRVACVTHRPQPPPDDWTGILPLGTSPAPEVPVALNGRLRLRRGCPGHHRSAEPGVSARTSNLDAPTR